MEIIGIKEKFIQETIQEPTPRPGARAAGAGAEEPARKETSPESMPKISLVDHEALKALTDSINHYMRTMRYSLQFVPEGEGGGMVIKVLDGNGHLIRRIPPEALQAISAKISGGRGVVVNEMLE